MGRTVRYGISGGVVDAAVVAGHNAGDPYRVGTYSGGSLTIDESPTNAKILNALLLDDPVAPDDGATIVNVGVGTGPLVARIDGESLPAAGEVVYRVQLKHVVAALEENRSYAAIGLGAPTDGRDAAWELASISLFSEQGNPIEGTITQPVSPSITVGDEELHLWVEAGSGTPWTDHAVVHVSVADVPTVNVTAPVGTVTTTATPTVTWTPTLDSAIGGQTNYDVRIFDSATHGDPLFDVDTSIPVASSGEVVGSANGWQSTALVNGTYFAYVRVAQTTSGEQVWSEWDSTTWTQDVDGPEWTSVVASDTGTGVEITATHDGVSPAWDRTEFERSTDGGTTWVFVGETTADPATTDPAAITDLWYQPGASTVWRVRGWDGPAAGSWTSSNTLAALDDTANGYLTAPTGDRTTIRPTTRAFQRTRRVGTHQVLGRSDPVGTSDVLGLRTGTLTLETWDAAEADALMAILEAHPVVHVALHVDLDIAPGWWQLASVGDNMKSQVADVHERLWTLQATEVAPPEGH